MTVPRSLTLAELAAESGESLELVERLVVIGAIEPLPDGRVDARDAAIVHTIGAIQAAGIDLDDIGWAIAQHRVGFTSVGRLFREPGPRSERTYAEFAATTGADPAHAAHVYAAFGLAEPEPGNRLRQREERVIADFLGLWDRFDPDGETHARVARIAGDATRRIAEGWLDAWDGVARPTARRHGAPEDAEADAENATIGMAELARELTMWLFDRTLEQTLNRRIIAAVERGLAEAGRLPAVTRRPPAIAFVDLSGFTSLTMERGDEAAAQAAAGLQDVAERCVRALDGRVVKLLGDGVLLRFPDAESALRATLEIVDSAVAAGLPPAHAGIAAGRVVVRDGDVFGGTVNLASRIADRADPGVVLVEEGVVVMLPRGIATFEPVGRVQLRGIPNPVALWRAAPATAATARS